MPARTARGAARATIARTTTADGLMVAPIRAGGRWAALRALHEGMHRLRDDGLKPALSFVIAIAEDGRIVPGRDPAAVLFVLGYRAV
jgi:hypothetical protein